MRPRLVAVAVVMDLAIALVVLPTRAGDGGVGVGGRPLAQIAFFLVVAAIMGAAAGLAHWRLARQP